jgi:hypothetical protein
MRIASFASLVLIGCGGAGGSTDVEATLLFADRSDVEIARLVAAASASEGFSAQGQLSQFDDPFEEDPCPTVVEDAANLTVTITGGCTTLDDITIEGSATIDNPLGWGDLDYDFNGASTYEFDGFRMIFAQGSFETAWDGVFTTGASFGSLDLDLTTEQLGVGVRSDLFLDCDRTECEHGESGLELVGVGGALVSGTIGVAGQTAVGSLTLRGQDTVEVSIANNCVRWELVGTGRSMAQGNCQ